MRVVVRPADFLVSPDGQDALWPPDMTPSRECRALDLLRRPGVTHAALTALPAVGRRPPAGAEEPEFSAAVVGQIEIDIRYEGYVRRQLDEIARARAYEDAALPEGLDYADVHGLSHELREKLSTSRPQTVGQASRLPGMTPAAVSILLVHMKKRRLRSA